MCLQTFHRKGPHLLWAGYGAARGKITVSVTRNRLNYFVIFIVNTQFTNVTAGRKIQPGGPQAETHVLATCMASYNGNKSHVRTIREKIQTDGTCREIYC